MPHVQIRVRPTTGRAGTQLLGCPGFGGISLPTGWKLLSHSPIPAGLGGSVDYLTADLEAVKVTDGDILEQNGISMQWDLFALSYHSPPMPSAAASQGARPPQSRPPAGAGPEWGS